MTDKVSSNNGNVMVFADSLGWLIGNEDLNAEVSSEEDVPIEHSRQQDKVWFYATTFAVPLPLLIVAAWIARRRRRPAEGNA
jgi:ABC-type long-subunit fatty acid transport system fused permease/ATPase subunit